MTILRAIEHWLATHDLVSVPEPLPSSEVLTMKDALADVRHHVEEMHAINRRLEARVAVAEAIAAQQARAHGLMPDQPESSK